MFDVIAAGGVIDIGFGLRLPLSGSAPHLISATIGGQPHTVMQTSDPCLTHDVVLDIRASLFPGQGDVINARPNQPAAREGVRFERAFSQSSWTKPSVAPLFTSLYPSNHGAFRGLAAANSGHAAHVLSQEAVTLAETLSGSGYRAFAYVCGIHPIPEFGFAQGFDTFIYRRTSMDAAPGVLRTYLESGDGPDPWAILGSGRNSGEDRPEPSSGPL